MSEQNLNIRKSVKMNWKKLAENLKNLPFASKEDTTRKYYTSGQAFYEHVFKKLNKKVTFSTYAGAGVTIKDMNAKGFEAAIYSFNSNLTIENAPEFVPNWLVEQMKDKINLD